MVTLILTMISIALSFIGGYAVGHARRRPALPLTPSQPQPICGCRHHLSYHDPATKRCTSGERREIMQSYGNYKSKWQDCLCKQYIGPEPIYEFTLMPRVNDQVVGKYLPDVKELESE